MAKISYRNLCPDDFPGVHQVALESWRAAYKDIYDDEHIRSMVDRNYGPESLQARLQKIADGSAYCEVAVRDGRVLGLTMLVFDERGAEMSRLYVLPECFGTKVGYMLVMRAIAYMRARGYHTSFGYVAKDNMRARKFYEHIGCRHDPTMDRGDTVYVIMALSPLGAVKVRLMPPLRRLKRWVMAAAGGRRVETA